MMSFTNSSNTCDGAARNARDEHGLWLVGYNASVEGSPMARLKKIIGGLLNLSMVGGKPTCYLRAVIRFNDDVVR